MTNSNREQQRALAKSRRAGMSAVARAEASAAIAEHLAASSIYRDAQIIGAYLALINEINLAQFIAQAQRDHKKVFVPRVTGNAAGMQFVRLRPETILKPNRFGIAEPDARESEYADPGKLHLVLLPLVAFDSNGNRLGMGAGFYDRSFAFRRNTASSEYPILCGAGFSCQRVATIDAKDWDVPLDFIVTEHGIENVVRTDTKS